MANTLIQIKRSSANAVPGSLSSSELAYSYVSDKLFIGTSDGLSAIAIGGKAIVDLANTIYNQANAAYNTANSGLSVSAAFAAANAAFANGNTNFTATQAAFNAANAAFANANTTHASLVANWGATNAAFSNANTTHTSLVNNWGATNAAFLAANSAFANANSTHTSLVNNWAATNAAFLAANSAYNNANSKFSSSGGTISGDVTITGTLTLTGNTVFANTETLRISDPLLYLAGNNYTTDAVDIGFVGNYVNATGSNVHTGFYREHTTKEYYLFYGYDKEPENNHIDPNGNNFTIAVLNADVRTSNLNLGGVNAISWLNAAYGAANAAFANANTTHTSLVNNWGATNAAFGAANAAFANANTTHTLTIAAFGAANASFANGNTNFATLQVAFGAANAAFNRANGSSNAANITSGTLSDAILVGQYANITGVGTLTGGTWQANTITVPYGGTGMTTFTTNGVLYGNSAGAIRVSAAGTDGQVLVASPTGVPTFAMLDGGTF